VYLAETGRRMGINDLWIAAIAVSRGLPVVTQDDDFAALDGASGFAEVRV
jgi:predicted nucleic acid-binding protein